MAFPEDIQIQIYSPFHIIIIRHLSETLFVSPILILMPSVMVHRHQTKEITMTTSNVLHHTNDEELIALIQRKESFTLTRVKNFSQTVKKIERFIEAQNLSCRVYTAGRSTTMAATLASGPAVIFGLASAAAISAHNLVTRNPDYEIAKYPLAKKLVINYKK